jgi:hypothetical protein
LSFSHWWAHFITAHNIKDVLPLSPLKSVVGFAAVVEIEVSFDPLTEFQVILVLGLY